MANPFARRKSLPQLANIDQVFERLKQQDPEWLASILNDRWSQISNGNNDDHVAPADPEAPARRPLLDRFKRRGQQAADLGFKAVWAYDITIPKLPRDRTLSAHEQLIRSHDWASTELGPMASWSGELRRMVNVCVSDPRPAGLWWTKSRILIYNEQYAVTLGKRHPAALGRRFADVWPEILDDFGRHFTAAEERGQATTGDNALYIVNRNGYPEELWASWAVMPVPAENSGVGCYNAVFDTTKQVLTERRMSTLLWLGQCTSAAKDTQDFWKQAVRGLEPNHYDVPFVALYAAASSESAPHPNHFQLSEQWEASSHGTPSPSERSSTFANKQWTLEGMLGLPASCPGLPSRVDTEAAAESITSILQNAIATGQTTVLTVEDGTFPKGLQGVAKSRAFGDECTAAVLAPVGPTNRENVLGFMLIGINPRHAYDTDYQQFIQLLVRQMATSIASVVLIEEELKRSRLAAELAAQDRIRLSEQLAVTKQEAQETEAKFRNMTAMAPVAMFHFDEMGNVLWANEAWFQLTGHPRDAFYPLSWYNVIHEGDHPIMDVEWAKLGRGERVEFELRLKRPFLTQEYVNGEQVEGTTWIIASAYTDKRPDGSVKGILGCLTDISRQKWIEGFQSRRTEEAMELKRQQENFMDMTSHEARNPLSAITLCAESITTMFKELVAAESDPVTLTKEAIATQLESAETISACASHQKRIIDDVLCLSKLDSGLLAITPVEVQPAQSVTQALKMFDGEVHKADIDLTYRVAPSYHALNIDWVRLDPSRLLQILINLLTNAIKFTQPQPTRRITVTLEASVERPSSFNNTLHYLPVSTAKDPVSPPSSDDIYLTVIVQDTGRGISPSEMKRLFQRFQQASPKTHIKYGGSGLGLFISRELARLQNGQIGVSSESGVGSTFAFFVRAQRCPPPCPKSPSRSPGADASPSTRKRSHASVLATETAHAHVTSDFAGLKASSITSRAATAAQDQHLLVVEDNLVNQKVMSKQLERAGYSVHVANHGAEALSHILASRFCKSAAAGGAPLDVVLMDVEMPVMDGLACARRIRQMEESGEVSGHVPVIAVTANARGEQQRMAIEAGMDAVVTKPFTMLELLPELERVKRVYGV